MLGSLLSILIAVFCLTFLIFIHELAHFFMARRVGMKVETFSIGFGKPLFSWVRDGVKWQIGCLPFGGFVKIAGMDNEGNEDPYQSPDGFFGKTPWQRIKVLGIAPLTNILFAALAFSALWFMGGREKSYLEFTPKIGWIDPHSALFERGVRPGDEVLAYNGSPFLSFKDHLTQAMMSGDSLNISLNKVDYLNKTKTPLTVDIKPYSHPLALDPGIKTSGILHPASFLIFNPVIKEGQEVIPKESAMAGSGLLPKDRLIWAGGELIFSIQQLGNLLNDGDILLTVQKGTDTFLRRVPRVKFSELRLTPDYREELIDLFYSISTLRSTLDQFYTIPYELGPQNVVEKRLSFFEKENEEKAFPKTFYSELNQPLEAGDKIIGVSGQNVKTMLSLFEEIQKDTLNVIVSRKKEEMKPLSLNEGTARFENGLEVESLKKMIASLGTQNTVKEAGDLVLLNPVVAKVRSDQKGSQKYLGLPGIQDHKIVYNPNPLQLLKESTEEIWKTLSSLVTGNFNPKWMSGPVGIIQVVQQQSQSGVKEMIFWLGFISFNLGVLNLLPIPVLDGGGIMMALYEWVTGRRIPPKVMEKVILPFALLLIAFFIFVTFYDVTRLLGKFF
jgi:regulator of sigma E protease